MSTVYNFAFVHRAAFSPISGLIAPPGARRTCLSQHLLQIQPSFPYRRAPVVVTRAAGWSAEAEQGIDDAAFQTCHVPERGFEGIEVVAEGEKQQAGLLAVVPEHQTTQEESLRAEAFLTVRLTWAKAGASSSASLSLLCRPTI